MASSASGAMAPPPPSAPSERDLASAAEARAAARKARAAQRLLAEFSQAQIDAIVDRMAPGTTFPDPSVWATGALPSLIWPLARSR